MNIHDVKIEKQIKASLISLVAFVILIGLVSYYNTRTLHQQMEKLYQHPHQVQRAVGTLKSDILSIHREMKDIVLAADANELNQNLINIEGWRNEAEEQIELLRNRYLGPKTDIDQVSKEFSIWNTLREETIRLVREGEIENASNRTKHNGIAGQKVDLILSQIETIDAFAQKKASEFKQQAKISYSRLTLQLIALIAFVLFLTVLINFFVYRSIKVPVAELTRATLQFEEGDFSVRSRFKSLNEFGNLSMSFNKLADKIELNLALNQKVAELSGVIMLSDDDPQHFLHTFLLKLTELTHSQQAALYLTRTNRKELDHFISIGMEGPARQSFSIEEAEGVFGATLLSGQIQHVKDLPEDTRFTFTTVNGSFIPREMLVIPLFRGKETMAVILLSTLNQFDGLTHQIIDKIKLSFSSRLENILAVQKIKNFSTQLEIQNHELEVQKNELSIQSSELQSQNTELEAQKKQLNEANRLKTIFLSNMSHELRTPLNSVIALSGVLNRRLTNKIPNEELSYLEVIERNGKHLLDLINDILDISRIEAGKEETTLSTFNLNTLIEEILYLIRPQAHSKNINLIFDPTDQDLTITSDAGKMKHIIQNLVGNAVKFTEVGQVELTSHINHNMLTITVSDTGIGISEENQAFIFDEFRQADSGTARKFGGTGLGLAIAKKYAHFLGGTIMVKSELNKGSVFTLAIPVSLSQEKTPAYPGNLKPEVNLPGREGKANLKSGTILIVDDSEPAIIQLKDILETSGCKVRVAHDGMEALGLIGNTPPDAILLDLMMPGYDGFQLLEKIRNDVSTTNIPVLILTAKHISKEELKFLKQNNIFQLIQKGNINREELLKSIGIMLSAKPGTTVPDQKRKPKVLEGKPRILVVEDNIDNLLTARVLLSDQFEVIEATDGSMGIAKAIEHQPDLILMDIQLPEIDGIEAFHQIRKNTRLQNIPIIALTASAMTTERETILAHGFDGYISKPIDEQVFLKTIKQVLFGS